jgi:hypothetical protein
MEARALLAVKTSNKWVDRLPERQPEQRLTGPDRAMSIPLNERRPVSRIRCGQEDFYGVAEAILRSYEEHKDRFMSYSGRYTPTTGTLLRAELSAARQLPSDEVRTARHAILRKGLDRLRADGLRRMLQLETFIRDAFGPALLDMKKQEAGFDLYDKAYNRDWNSMKGMLVAAGIFIADNLEALTTIGGMVAGSEAGLNDLKDEFSLQLTLFVKEEERARRGTDEKIRANNVLYEKIILMCSDGRKIFWDKGAIREEFTYEAVLHLVRGLVPRHGVGGTVKGAHDGIAVVNGTVLLEELLPDGTSGPVRTVRTNRDGLYKFKRVRAGRYRLTATGEGLEPERRMITVEDRSLVVDFGLRRMEGMGGRPLA